MKSKHDDVNQTEKRTKRFGLILSDISKSTDYPESGMRPDCRCFVYEFAPRGDHFEVVRSYSLGP